MKSSVRLCALLACILIGTSALAAVPTSITVQGRLSDSAGDPVAPGIRNFTFKIYDAEVGGTEIWPAGAGEDQSITTAGDGLWTALVGAIIPLAESVFADSIRWLELTVGDGINPPETLPRIRLTTGPYAQRVATVDGASGGTIASKVSIGATNTNTGIDAFVAGNTNTASGDYSVIGGGRENSASDTAAAVSGGRANSAAGRHAFVGGGFGDSANADFAVVAGGFNNVATDISTSIGGGYENTATNQYSTVAGGFRNTAGGAWSFIGGGQSNETTGANSSVGGGSQNDALGLNSTVGGGSNNTAGTFYSTVAGGNQNQSTGYASSIGGGTDNSISGDYSCIPGGRDNNVAADYSFGAGRRAIVSNSGCFVWADAVNANFATTANNQFLVRAGGGVGINTNSPYVDLTLDGSIGFKNGFSTMLYIYQSGASNPTRSVFAHSPAYPNWGLEYRDSGDLLVFESDGYSVMTVDLGDRRVGIGTTAPQQLLDVRGTIGNAGTVYHSDRRWKTNVRPIRSSLERIMKLQGVEYEWKRDEYPEMKFPEGQQIGLIAQNVESVIPEVVNTNSERYKSVDYARLVALLIEGMKEQQEEIEELKAVVSQLTQ